MKEQRFEKVVEWEDEPRYAYIFTAIMIIVIAVTSIMIFPKDMPIIRLMFLNFSYIIAIMIGVAMFTDVIGHGRKVYWRKIK